MTKQEILKIITSYASDRARAIAEERFDEGKETDFDDAYQLFTEEIDNAIMDGIDEGLNRWDNEKPTEYDYYDEHKEEILCKMGLRKYC